MVNAIGGVLIATFIAIIIGTALIDPISDDVELSKVSSITIDNESLSFSISTQSAVNENITNNGDGATMATFNLKYNNVTVLSSIANATYNDRTTQCNVTLASGAVQCNLTNSSYFYVNYTYVSKLTETLAYDEVKAVNSITNATSPSNVLTGHCNVTLANGNLVCNNTHSLNAYINYSYEPDTYVHSSTARTSLTLTVLFFAIAILAFGIGAVMKSFREGGLG